MTDRRKRSSEPSSFPVSRFPLCAWCRFSRQRPPLFLTWFPSPFSTAPPDERVLADHSATTLEEKVRLVSTTAHKAAVADMEEESLSTVLTVVVPAAVGVSLVVATIAIIFWLGAGRQTSYEDAVKARQGHAERELRKMAEKEREQRQRKEKKRPGRGRRHEAGRPEGETAESTPQQLPPATQKSILKSSKPNSVPKVRPAHTHHTQLACAL